MTSDQGSSAAAIQWKDESRAFARTFSLLATGGMLASSGFKTPNPELYDRIQEVYSLCFKPTTLYQHNSFGCRNAPFYGFCAGESAAYCGTHCDHLVIEKPFQ